MRLDRLHGVLDRRRLSAFGLGALSVLAWAPVQWAPLLWITLGLLYVLLDKVATPRAAAALGLAFGLGLFLAGVSWVYVSLSLFGGMPAVLAAVSTLLFCLMLAIFPALAAAAFAALRGASALRNALLFAALWGFADWLRGWIFTGFPWLALGYTQTPGGPLPAPLQGFGPVLGVYGLSVLCALLGGVAGEWLRGLAMALRSKVAWAGIFCKGRESPPDKFDASGATLWLMAGLSLSLLAGGALLGRVVWTTPIGAPISVALLQGNISQDLKWSPERFEDSLRVYHDLARDHPAQLTILPETALPAFFDQLPDNYLRAMKALAQRQDGNIVLGSVLGDAKHYTNSVVSLGSAPGQRYDKSHLVPFGEFIPPGFSWAMRWLSIPMAGFTPGNRIQPPFDLSGQQVAFNICYEDVFGEEIAGALPVATVLANVSNTAWFGRSLAQPQHLQIAQMRALETGRPMLRATNTGMTAALRPDGTVQARLAPFSRGALVVEVQGTSGLTPYARMQNYGALLLMVLFSLPALVARWKSR